MTTRTYAAKKIGIYRNDGNGINIDNNIGIHGSKAHNVR